MKIDFKIDGCYETSTVPINTLRPGDTIYFNRRLAMIMVPPIGGGQRIVHLDYGDIVNLPNSFEVFPTEDIKVVFDECLGV